MIKKRSTAISGPRFVCVTNIPSPYRLYEFELLNEELVSRGGRFEAIFMARSEWGRHWDYDPDQWPFRSWVSRGIHLKWRDATFHVNPGIALHLVRNPPTWLLMGGSWNMPTVFLMIAAARIAFPRTALLYWTEGTLSYAKFSDRGFWHSLKRSVLSQMDAYVVPGQRSVEYLQELFNGRKTTCLRFANIIDEGQYSNKVAQKRKNRDSLRAALDLGDEIAFIWPARLIPEKGILEFLGAIAECPSDGLRILIAGDGPLRRSIESILESKNMRHVSLLGQQSPERMLELYACCDILLLPSLREVYGFAAVEAIFAGLPLLISNNVGSLPEVLVPGENGWSFDPLNRAQIVGAVKNAVALGRPGLAAMGQRSLEVAAAKFNGRASVREFVDNLTKLGPRRKTRS